jgi:alkane 1-monooxygenase
MLGSAAMTARPARPRRARPAVPVAPFAAATLLPFGLCAAGAAGGAWAFAGLAAMTLVLALADQVVPAAAPGGPDGAEVPAGDGLLAALALALAAALPLATRAVAGPGSLGAAERLAVALGWGLWLGQVAVPAAHELIHRADRRLSRLGAAMFGAILFGHHSSAHRLVHHRHVATAADPNTARRGEGFYRFALRAWTGSFRAGLRAETARRGRRGPHPYLGHAAAAVLALAAAWAAAGPAGAAVWTLLSLHAQAQLLLADYVQHYGLLRATGPDGRPEPVGPQHAWNAPHRVSGFVALHASRHSDHHAHPARPYPALRLPAADAAPVLPVALPLACAAALVPPLWRRLMHPHLARWRPPS